MRLQNSKSVFKQFLPFGSLDRDLKIIFASNLLAAFGDGFIVYLLPLFIRSLNATPENVGMLYSLSTAAAALTMIPGGFLADKYDRKKLLLFNWLLWIPIPLAFFFAANWTQLIIPMFVYGITLSGSASSAYILGHCKEGKTASAFTTLGSAYAIGYIFSPLTAGFLASSLGVRGVFVFTAVLYSLSAFTLTRIRSQHPCKAEDPAVSDTKEASGTKGSGLWKLGLVSALFAVMMFTFALVSALVPQFLSDVYHYDLSGVLYLGSITYVGAFLLSFAAGRLGDKHGKMTAVAFALLLMGLASAIFISFAGWGFQVVAAFLRGASFPMWAYIGVLAGSYAPVTQQAKWISVVQTATRVASIPAAFVGGLLYEMSYQTPFIVCIAVALALSVLVNLRLFKSKT